MSEDVDLLYQILQRVEEIGDVVRRVELKQAEISKTLVTVQMWLANPQMMRGIRESDLRNQMQEIAASMECPVCHGQMVLRKKRMGSVPFLGCGDFPNCIGSRSIQGNDTTKRVKELKQGATWNTSLSDAKNAPDSALEPDDRDYY